MGLRYLIAIPGNREEFPAALDTVLARLGLQGIDGDFCCRLYLNMPERRAQFAGGRGFIVGDLFGRSEASAKIGRAHVFTPVPNAHLVCSLLLVNEKSIQIIQPTSITK